MGESWLKGLLSLLQKSLYHLKAECPSSSNMWVVILLTPWHNIWNTTCFFESWVHKCITSRKDLLLVQIIQELLKIKTDVKTEEMWSIRKKGKRRNPEDKLYLLLNLNQFCCRGIPGVQVYSWERKSLLAKVITTQSNLTKSQDNVEKPHIDSYLCVHTCSH